MNLQNLFHGLYRPHYNRALVFSGFSIVIYSLQFLYICFQIILLKKGFNREMSDGFVAYAIFDFLVCVLYFQPVLINGAQTNKANLEIKQQIAQL